MSLLTRTLSALGLERRSEPLGLNGWPMPATPGNVTATTAQSVSAVYACVQAISETVASLPLIVYRRKGEDRERATDHPLYTVLHDQANPEQTALEMRELMQANVLLSGNAYARIVRGYDGQVRELWPMHPNNVQVRRSADNLVYDYTDGTNTPRRLLAHEVLHLRHRIGDDGILGVSPIAAARGVVELAMAEREHGTSTFRNGAKLLGVLKFPGLLKPDQRTAIANSWASQHGGAANSGRTAILEQGVDFQPVSINMADAQWLESRQFSVEEVARLFRVPPTVIGDLRNGNYSNSVEMARQFLTQTLRRHLVSWEQAIASKCLTEAGRRVYWAEHEVNGMLRGDSTTRAAFYSSAIASGWMQPSFAARLENMPLFDGIDAAADITAVAAPGAYPSKQ